MKIFTLKIIILFLVLAFVLDYVYFGITYFNSGYGHECSGFGSINRVIEGHAQAPMQHRVLFPWIYMTLEKLIGFNNRSDKIAWIYEPLRILTIFLALLGIYYFFSWINRIQINLPRNFPLIGTLLFCALVPLSFLYDYHDHFLDILFISLGFVGILRADRGLMLNGAVFLGTLNRETTFLILPVLNFLFWYKKKDMLDLVIPFLVSGYALLIPRLIYGIKFRYYDLWQAGRNLDFLSKIGKYPQEINITKVVLPYFNPSWFFIPAFGFLIFLAIKNFKTSHTFFRWGVGIISFITIFAFCFAVFGEIRIFSWFYLILIPMALQNIRITEEPHLTQTQNP